MFPAFDSFRTHSQPKTLGKPLRCRVALGGIILGSEGARPAAWQPDSLEGSKACRDQKGVERVHHLVCLTCRAPCEGLVAGCPGACGKHRASEARMISARRLHDPPRLLPTRLSPTGMLPVVLRASCSWVRPRAIGCLSSCPRAAGCILVRRVVLVQLGAHRASCILVAGA
jgi:hypothetical protein